MVTNRSAEHVTETTEVLFLFLSFLLFLLALGGCLSGSSSGLSRRGTTGSGGGHAGELAHAGLDQVLGPSSVEGLEHGGDVGGVGADTNIFQELRDIGLTYTKMASES